MVAAAQTAPIEQRTAEITGTPVRWLAAPTPGGADPCLYVHGVPTGAFQWRALLERTGGLAPDLPGFGRSGKRADYPYTIEGLSAFVEAFCEHNGLRRVRLVAQDWGGGIALAWAQRRPERVARLVLIDSVPLLPGYRWHRIARVWRTRGLGELAMGASTRWALRQISREASATPGPMPDEFIDAIHERLDQGTQRAILRLYRASPPEALARAGERLGAIEAPALIVWGREDPYIPARFAELYADALGGEAQVRIVEGAGHWPWVDRPELVGEICAFLDA